MNNNLSNDQIDFFQSNGFIVIDDFLSPDELEYWRSTVMNGVKERKGIKIRQRYTGSHG